MEEKRKVGMRPINWFLSIGGIIFLVLLMVLPPVFRIVFEEKIVINDQENNGDDTLNQREPEIDDSSYLKMTCSKQDTTSLNYVENKSLVFAYQESSLKIVSDTVVHTYTLANKDNESLFSKARLSCTNTPTTYYQVKGLNYNCTATDDTIQITSKYDLTKFQTTVLTNSSGTEETIQSSYLLDQNINEIKIALVSSGYTCQ